MRYFVWFIAVFTIILSSGDSYAQDQEPNLLSLGFWKLSSVSGELKAGTLYSQSGMYLGGTTVRDNSTNYYGGISLSTNSFIWNPNFMNVGISAGYLPQSHQDQYLYYPNRTDVINSENLHFNTILLPKKPISLGAYLNFDNTFDSRENLSDIKTESKTMGSTLTYTNKFLPANLSYNVTDWNQKEIQTNRVFSYKDKIFNGRISKTFKKLDRNELSYTHREDVRTDFNVSPANYVTDNVELNNSFSFDSANRTRFTSNIAGISQRGLDSFQQVRTSENFMTTLPFKIHFNSGYTFNYVNRPSQDLIEHDINFSLSHQLYQSLYTGITGGYNQTFQSDYTEAYMSLGGNVTYNKSLGKIGQLAVSYGYSKVRDKRVSQDVLLQKIGEPYLLADNQIVMFKLPYVNQATVVVKDVTGTIIYQEYFDYNLILRNNYLEIQRVPGGQIPNNTTVYISYTANQPGNTQFDANNNNFSVDLSFLRRLIGVYYRFMANNYSNVKNTDGLFLNYLTYYLYGIRSEYKFISGGAEIDDYQSSLYPYRMTRYFLTMQGTIKRRFVVSLNANERIYDHLPNNEMNRIYQDVNGLLAYSLTRRTKIDFNLIYNYQHGQEINLDLLSAKLRISTVIRDMVWLAGIEAYNRLYLDTERNTYFGGYIQVSKKFKY